MAINFDSFSAKAEAFNKKYGVKFDIVEFDGQTRALTENFAVTKSAENNLNTYYRMAFTRLFKEAFANFIDHKIASFMPDEMLSDFEESVMGPYRAACKKENMAAPGVNAGWTKKEFMERAKAELQNIPDDKREYARTRYMNGELRVRDVRAFREELQNKGGYNHEKLSTLICYSYALGNAVISRSFWWKVMHPFKNSAEKKELATLRNYIGITTGSFDITGEDETIEYVRGDEIASDKAIEKYKQAIETGKNNLPDEADVIIDERKLNEKVILDENSLDEKSLDEIGDILDKRAAYEDQMMEKIIEREEQQKRAEKNKEAEIIASFKKPTNRIEVKRAFADKNMAQLVSKQFVALMEKATNTGADKEAKANSAYRSLGMMIGEFWVNQNNMHANAIKFFKTTYNAIKNDTPGMSIAEKLVAAQKMADIMLNAYSPAATNPDLAQYGESYGIQKIDNDAIKELTGFKGDVNELMNSVKVELGIGRERVNFDNEFGEAANDKSAKVEEPMAPVAENVK